MTRRGKREKSTPRQAEPKDEWKQIGKNAAGLRERIQDKVFSDFVEIAVIIVVNIVRTFYSNFPKTPPNQDSLRSGWNEQNDQKGKKWKQRQRRLKDTLLRNALRTFVSELL